MGRKKKSAALNFAEDIPAYEEVEEPILKLHHQTRDDENLDIEEKQLASFAGMDSIEDVLQEDVEYDSEEMNHPAEIAARYKTEEDTKTQVGGSDDQILKDLRKMVFTVPLLRQEEVDKLFIQIDQCIFPTVYAILEASPTFFDEIFKIFIKISAGNTYGKNIYEKTQESANEESRGTFKKHETGFLVHAYELFVAAISEAPETRTTQNLEKIVGQCSFIRGIYEDILEKFVKETKNYNDDHWKAVQANIDGDQDEYYRYLSLIQKKDKELQFSNGAYYVVREAQRIHQRYMDFRSQIIAPYLRSVYSVAKNTSKNPHQMLENFQNGSLGLLRAVSCYSVNRSASFASVAKWWVKQVMLLSIKEDCNFVKLPVSTWQAYTQFEKARVRASIQVEDYESIAKETKTPLKKVKSVYYTVRISQVYSLNKPYDDKVTLADIVTTEDTLWSSEDSFQSLLRDCCDLAKLTDLERKVIALKFGMLDIISMREHSNDEVYRECLIQNLASIGFNYKFAS
jgi:DNA-directed RNA polymerase sigma subunit (sigma70/sigma32)